MEKEERQQHIEGWWQCETPLPGTQSGSRSLGQLEGQRTDANYRRQMQPFWNMEGGERLLGWQLQGQWWRWVWRSDQKVDKDWVTISKIAVPLKGGAAMMAAEVMGMCVLAVILGLVFHKFLCIQKINRCIGKVHDTKLCGKSCTKKDIYELKNSDKASFHFPDAVKEMPAPTTSKRPKIRRIIDAHDDKKELSSEDARVGNNTKTCSINTQIHFRKRVSKSNALKNTTDSYEGGRQLRTWSLSSSVEPERMKQYKDSQTWSLQVYRMMTSKVSMSNGMKHYYIVSTWYAFWYNSRW